MIDFRLGRYALGASAAFAMLAGCDGRASNGVVPLRAAPSSIPNHKSFYYTGGPQDFTVPRGVSYITVVARGAHGAGSPVADGGRVHAVIPVTPGEQLVVYVGGDASGSTSGFNGGGNGGADYGCYSGHNCTAYGGGGASDVRQGGDGLVDRVLVVGGGGGQGGKWSKRPRPTGGRGGKGGGTTGGSGAEGGGRGSNRDGGGGGAGGTQSAGGSGGSGSRCSNGGNPGSSGMLLAGGAGGQGGESYGSGPGGGGGGGGYYGGGGGGAGSSFDYYCSLDGGGGGGGSSYVERKATSVHLWQGWKNPAGNGLVVFSWRTAR